jgi:putative tryptophan/tyrosine transport system permease protein
MTLLIGAWTVGLILSLLALGVFISFRVFNFPDITTEGSITMGAVTAAVLLVDGVAAPVATFAGFATGAIAGAATGVLHTKFGINGLLSGIIVMTALYSVNLRVMGQSNLPLLNVPTLATDAERLGRERWWAATRCRCGAGASESATP